MEMLNSTSKYNSAKSDIRIEVEQTDKDIFSGYPFELKTTLSYRKYGEEELKDSIKLKIDLDELITLTENLNSYLETLTKKDK